MSLLTGSRTTPEIEDKDPDLHILLQLNYTEKLSKNVRVRRTAVKKAIRKDSFNSVYRKMEKMEDTLGQDYKNTRLKEDMNWLKSNSHRFNQTIFS